MQSSTRTFRTCACHAAVQYETQLSIMAVEIGSRVECAAAAHTGSAAKTKKMQPNLAKWKASLVEASAHVYLWHS